MAPYGTVGDDSRLEDTVTAQNAADGGGAIHM